MTRSSIRRLLPALALFIAALASAPASAGPYDTLVVFGDSLSDSGNNTIAIGSNPAQVITGNTYVPSQTYGSGVYSNGPVWATDAAAKLGVPLAPSLAPGGTNYSYGGATTGPAGNGFPFSLLVQSGQYLAATANHASANGLYVIAGGGNDARAALTAIGGGADPLTTIGATAASFAANVGSIVDALQLAGAQHIIVWDAPNVGLAPAVVASGAGGLATFLSSSMNSALAARLAGEAGVTTFDLFGLNTQIATNPALFGFTNAKDACGAVPGANCDQYAYWDGIHPTAAAHGVIADAFFAVAVPEPETWLLMVGGLAALGAMSRRRAKSGQPA